MKIRETSGANRVVLRPQVGDHANLDRRTSVDHPASRAAAARASTSRSAASERRR